MTLTAVKSILVGVGGSLILSLFCTTFMALEKVLFILPLFVAFNGLMTGYRLVEALKSKIRNIVLFTFVMGIGTGALTFSAVNVAGMMMPNGFSLSVAELLIYTVVSGVTSVLGAKLAVKYFKL